MAERIEYERGQVINTLVFIEEAAPLIMRTGKPRRALFQCSCGKKFVAIVSDVRSGNTKTCGCYIRPTKHGKCYHRINRLWRNIKTRCYNTRREDYKWYGSRGIKMSDAFKNDFVAFFNHVTSLPNYENIDRDNLSIDRVNNNGDYEEGNLRWATKSEQIKNSRPYLKSKNINYETG